MTFETWHFGFDAERVRIGSPAFVSTSVLQSDSCLSLFCTHNPLRGGFSEASDSVEPYGWAYREAV